MIINDTKEYKLINGDTLTEMQNLGIKVDKIITSPPYNIIRPNSTDRGYDLYKDRNV